MSPKEQADAVKLLRRWLDLAQAAKKIPGSDPVELLSLFEGLITKTDLFLSNEPPDDDE